MLIDGQEVQVGHFMRRNKQPGQNEWTNCYVKKIPYKWDDAKLNEEFSKFGEVLSASIARGTRKPFRGKKPSNKKLDTPAEDKKEDVQKEQTKEEKTEEDQAWEAVEKTEARNKEAAVDGEKENFLIW